MSNSNIDSFVERNYRSEKVELETLAYICKRKPKFATDIDPDWMSSDLTMNVLIVMRDLKAVMSKETLFTALKTKKLIGKGELQLYKETLDNIYSINTSTINDKSIKVNIQHIIEMFEGRTMLYGMRDIIDNIKNITTDDLKLKLREISAGVKLQDEILGGNYIDGIEDRVKLIIEKQELTSQGKYIGIPTGIRAFDILTGGLIKPEFGVIAGQPGIGKSVFLDSLAINAWQEGYNVLFVSGEMPSRDVEFRLDADLAGISATKFRFGNLTKKEMEKWRDRISEESNKHDNFLEVVSFPRNFTTDDIELYANEIQDTYEQEIHLICLDYLNILSANSSKYYNTSTKGWESQAEAVWDVKSLCADLNGGTALWTAGQIKDEAIDSEVLSLDDLKYARAISETAPLVVGLVRSQDDEVENIIELQILKMRNAELPKKSILLHPNLEYMRIHEEIVPAVRDLTLIQSDMKSHAPDKKKKNNSSRRL